MKSQDEVETQARAELSKKKAELLRIQQELNRKLKSAERQRNKRRKPNSSVLQENKVCLVNLSAFLTSAKMFMELIGFSKGHKIFNS